MFTKINKFLRGLLFQIQGRKKFLSCPWLEHGIIFDHAGIIRVCCEQSHEGKGRYILDSEFNGLWLDIDKINNKKKKQKNLVRQGIVPEACKGCFFLKEDYWDDKNYFSNVLLTHWSKCNAECIYCPAIRDNNLSDDKHYNIIPILQQLFDKKLITEKTHFSIAGGEATIYPEFDKLLYFLVDSGITNININSSGIRYSASIADVISKNLAEIVISIDCSSPVIYQKIKGVDRFNTVVNNIKRYLEAEQINEKRVIVKFIMLKGINDSIKDVLDWFLLCKNLGIKKIALDIDIAWYNEIGNNIPEYITEIIKFAKYITKLNNVDLDLYDRAYMIYKSAKLT